MKAHVEDGNDRAGERKKSAASPGPGLSDRADVMLSLQRAAGNRAVSRLVGQVPASVQRAATPSEFAIKGKFPGAGEVANSIFFDINEQTPDAAELTKIAPLAGAASTPLVLKGTASEEGATGLNASIVNARIANVSNALAAAGHTAARTPEAVPLAGVGNIDYRRARSVEIRTAGLSSATPDCSLGPQPTDGGPAPNPFTTALARAHAMIADARTKLKSGADPDVINLLFALFHTTTVSAVVDTNLARIDGQLNNMAVFTPTHGHQVVNNCDASCGGGAEAYNEREGTAAMMTLCPIFMSNPDLDGRAAALIHEGSHGTDGLATEDNAYQFQRLITNLPQDRALNNADSYAAFVRGVANPGSVTLGPAVADVHEGGMTAPEQTAVDGAVAWLEQWLMGTVSETSSCYGIVHASIAAGKWTDPYYQDTMGLIAPLFGLTPPPAVPTEKDKVAVAGINDRMQHLSDTLQSGPLTLEKVAGAGTTWSAGPGNSVKIGTAFFALGARQQVETLLGKIIAALPAIPASRRANYAKLVLDIVTHGDAGSP
ncbi:MAG: Lysine-specific metallo-endopeptidase [Mycobacterium sp.]|nr:Lysine-specific metallo-endopeptidase [Mycobacterium sp.]